MEEMAKYHSDDYVKFLRNIRPDNMSEYTKQMQRCGFELTNVFYLAILLGKQQKGMCSVISIT